MNINFVLKDHGIGVGGGDIGEPYHEVLDFGRFTTDEIRTGNIQKSIVDKKFAYIVVEGNFLYKLSLDTFNLVVGTNELLGNDRIKDLAECGDYLYIKDFSNLLVEYNKSNLTKTGRTIPNTNIIPIDNTMESYNGNLYILMNDVLYNFNPISGQVNSQVNVVNSERIIEIKKGFVYTQRTSMFIKKYRADTLNIVASYEPSVYKPRAYGCIGNKYLFNTSIDGVLKLDVSTLGLVATNTENISIRKIAVDILEDYYMFSYDSSYKQMTVKKYYGSTLLPTKQLYQIYIRDKEKTYPTIDGYPNTFFNGTQIPIFITGHNTANGTSTHPRIMEILGGFYKGGK